MATLAYYLDGLMVKNGPAYQGLAIYPVCLISNEFEKSGEELLTLEEGLRGGGLQVLETGNMEYIRVANRNVGRAAVLEGETLIGGAQNRMLNAGTVLASGAESELPTSCVEVHRWDCRPGEEDIPPDKRIFKRADVAFGSLKRLKMKESIHSLHTGREIRIDQQKVWKHIVENFGVSGAKTKTLDLHDLYEFWESPLQLFSTRFTVARNQVGLITFLDRRTWFADVFINNDLLFKNFKKLVRAYAFDALIRLEKDMRPFGGKAPTQKDATDVFKSLKPARLHPFNTGTGSKQHNCFFSTNRFCGTAMADGNTLIHMTACSK